MLWTRWRSLSSIGLSNWHDYQAYPHTLPLKRSFVLAAIIPSNKSATLLPPLRKYSLRKYSLRKYSDDSWRHSCSRPRLRAGLDFAAGLPFSYGWNLWALLALCASAAQVLQKTKIGSVLSAPLLAILLGVALSALGIIPLDCPAYDRISEYLLPLAAALYLLESDLRELASTARDTVVAFLLATLGTVVGTVIAWQAVGHLLSPDSWKVAAALCGSYIGGSVNFAAVSSALVLPPGHLLAAAMSADMVAMAGYLALISWWPVTTNAPPQSAESRGQASASSSSGTSVDSMSMSLAAAVTACALGSSIADLLGIPGFTLGVVAVIASCLASAGMMHNSAKGQASPFQGAEALGGALMSFFFVTIGASAGSVFAIFETGWLTGFIAIQLAVHLAITVGVGRLLGLPMQAILTASNAAIGGPGTAAAMATSRRWNGMVRPALVVGALGYSIGTVIGVSVGHSIQPV